MDIVDLSSQSNKPTYLSVTTQRANKEAKSDLIIGSKNPSTISLLRSTLSPYLNIRVQVYILSKKIIDMEQLSRNQIYHGIAHQNIRRAIHKASSSKI